ncbi:hypothetical protein, partial [Bradyrhizobium sp.]|uniref:hypothetical protein n=1 Tax=Bradyrhizobium sp. TaxID=376 RepID=UPI0025BC50F8
KLSVIHRLLDLRAGRSRAFLEGGYEPLEADEGVCGFVRGGEVAVVVAVRPGVEVAPPGRWRQVVAEPGISVSER